MKYIKYILLAMLFLGTAAPGIVVYEKINYINSLEEIAYTPKRKVRKVPYASNPVINDKFQVSNPIIKETLEIELPD